MKIHIEKKENQLINETYDDNVIIYKRKYSSKIIFIKVIVALLYAFGLGYSLFFFGDNFIKVGLFFLPLLIISYILMEFPYALLQSLLLPKAFSHDNINLYFNPFTLAISITSKARITKIRVILSLITPFLILSLIPTLASFLLEFNVYYYAIGSAAAIIGTKYIIYALLIIKNYVKGNLIKLDLNKFIFFQ